MHPLSRPAAASPVLHECGWRPGKGSQARHTETTFPVTACSWPTVTRPGGAMLLLGISVLDLLSVGNQKLLMGGQNHLNPRSALSASICKAVCR